MVAESNRHLGVRSVFVLAFLFGACRGAESREETPPIGKAVDLRAATGDPAKLRATSTFKVPSRQAVQQKHELDTCYFAALSLLGARDTYLTPLTDGEPRADHIPWLGAPGPVVVTSKASSVTSSAPSGPIRAAIGMALPPGLRAPALALPRELGFLPRLRSCAVSRQQQAQPLAGVDDVLQTFEPFVTQVARWMEEAGSYYARRGYERDDFERGRALHRVLTSVFPRLDTEVGRLDAALRRFPNDYREGEGEFDRDGEVRRQALVEARRATLLVLEERPDEASVRRAVGAVAAEHARLEPAVGGPESSDAGGDFTRHYEQWLEALEVAAPMRKPLSAVQSFPITVAFADLVASGAAVRTRANR